MLQGGRKFSQHAAKIYRHNVALKYHKVVEFCFERCPENFHNLQPEFAVCDICDISVLFPDWLVFCHT